MIPVRDARRIVMSHARPLPDADVPLLEAIDLVVAEDIVSPLSFPTFDSSAMDGFAVRAADAAAASQTDPVTLPVVFSVAAGDTADRWLAPGTACRIMTGARLPKGADAVIMLEDVVAHDGHVRISEAVPPGEFVRPCGEDLERGSTVLRRGDPLTPSRLALLAAIGLDRVKAFRRPTVAVLSTGDEVVEPGAPLRPGQVYNSNAYAMAAWIMEAGAIPVRLPIVPDSLPAAQALLRQALACDAVITSGGVSMGDHDVIGKAFAAMGTVHFTRVAQQPGKPFTFATIEGTPVFGLPGNPSATMVGLEIYVRPALRAMMGHSRCIRPTVQAILAETVSLKPDRMQWLRARLSRESRGYAARLTGPQGSGLITAMAWANALLAVPPGTGRLQPGDAVPAIVLTPELLVDEGIGYDTAESPG